VPELPETETIARDLHAALAGATVRECRVIRRDVLRGSRAPAFIRALSNAKCIRVWRRAKSIVLDLSEQRHLVVTPRFTGTLLLTAAGDYACLTFALSDGRTLTYRDVRRLGTVALLNPRAFVAWTESLGPEPLDPALTAERFSGILRGSSRAVKSVLMDQRKLAGVGNIYANEACWRARVRPQRSARALKAAETEALLRALRSVLAESIALRGTTFRDFRDAYGERGGFAARLAVYGRGGEPCPTCGSTLRESHDIDRRSTVWCANCQR
jgi:formamidopyrimidine-DNA glycosylase